jgi:hypothetical protein
MMLPLFVMEDGMVELNCLDRLHPNRRISRHQVRAVPRPARTKGIHRLLLSGASPDLFQRCSSLAKGRSDYLAIFGLHFTQGSGL